MQKYGRNIKTESQLYFNHAIHLTILYRYILKMYLVKWERQLSIINWGRNSTNFSILNRNIKAILSETRKIIIQLKDLKLKIIHTLTIPCKTRRKNLCLILDCKNTIELISSYAGKNFTIEKLYIKITVEDFEQSSLTDANILLLDSMLKTTKPIEKLKN